MTDPATHTLPAGFVSLTCPECHSTGVIWDDGVTLLDYAATGRPMRPGGEIDCPTCGGSGRAGRYWIRQQPADAWTVTVTDERTGTVHVRHRPAGEHSRELAAASAVALLLEARPAADPDGPEWRAMAWLERCVEETGARVEAHDRRHGLRVDVRPTDPAHPTNA